MNKLLLVTKTIRFKTTWRLLFCATLAHTLLSTGNESTQPSNNSSVNNRSIQTPAPDYGVRHTRPSKRIKNLLRAYLNLHSHSRVAVVQDIEAEFGSRWRETLQVIVKQAGLVIIAVPYHNKELELAVKALGGELLGCVPLDSEEDNRYNLLPIYVIASPNNSLARMDPCNLTHKPEYDILSNAHR